MPNEIARLSREMLHDPFTISVERQSAPAVGITQAAYPVAQHLKPVLLTELMKRGIIRSVIVFTRTKARANRLADYLVRMGVSSGRIHGDRSQPQRTETMRRFKEGKFAVLVATDIAARGIDVEALSHVINFDIPPTHEDYIHRVGRTGRNQSQGDAFAFVSPEEEGALRAIERAIGHRMPRVTLPDFDYEAGRPAVPEAAKFRGDREGAGRGRSSSPKPYTRFGANRGGQAASGGHQGHRAQQSRQRDDRTRPARAQVVGSGIRIDGVERSAGSSRGADRFAQAAATNRRQALRGNDADRAVQTGGEAGTSLRKPRAGGHSFGSARRKTFGRHS
jgi:ATP-dependent RNA helicase RhlE